MDAHEPEPAAAASKKPSRRAVLVAALIAGAAWTLAALAYRDAARVTFTRDIAPIGLEHCAPCHRPGQTAPFDLLTYADYREHAQDLAWVVKDRYMPPWKPLHRDGRFVGDRALDDAQIALFQTWVDDGMPQGDPEDLPPTPKWPRGWQLGKPDRIVTLDAPYTLGASGSDEYRNFVIRAQAGEPKYVVGWEFKPGSRAVHHAILKVDRMGNARRADAEDPAPGFGAIEFDGAQAPDGFYLVWAPGKAPLRTRDGSAWRLDASTDLVLQLHLQRSGKQERVDPQIALYFTDTPPSFRRHTLRIGDRPIDIPPGEKSWRMKDSYTLPVDVRVLGLFPHAHFLARHMRIWSRTPDGDELELLGIGDWDFNWQDEYSYVDPPVLPAGSTLEMEFVYDNSADNVRNPNRPPKRVTGGFQSTDEMGNVTFQLTPVDPRDTEALLESKYRQKLARSPGAEPHYNLANTLAKQGKRRDAVLHYRTALELQPKLRAARVNLAGVLVAEGELAEAVAQLEAAIALAPEQVEARLFLAHVLEQLGRGADAQLQYREVLRLDPSSARARAALNR